MTFYGFIIIEPQFGYFFNKGNPLIKLASPMTDNIVEHGMPVEQITGDNPVVISRIQPEQEGIWLLESKAIDGIDGQRL